MLELTNLPVASEGDTTAVDAHKTHSALAQEFSVEQADVELFAPADLEAFAKAEYGPLHFITQELITMAQKEPEYGTDNPIYGRFALSSYAYSAFGHRLALRLARQALDFLESDYLACESSDLEFWRRQVDAIDTMRSGITLGESDVL